MFSKKSWAGFILAFVLPISLVLVWWGAFNHTDIRLTRSDRIRYAYIDFYGNLADLPTVQDKLHSLLLSQRIDPGDPIVVLYTDPRKTGVNAQRAHIGYMIDNTIKVALPIQSGFLPAQNVLRAQVQASVQLAPSMAYQALHNYLKPQGKDIQFPTVEHYSPGHSISQMGTLTIDMPD